MIFTVALFDSDGNFRGVSTSNKPNPQAAALNGVSLAAIDLGCFDLPAGSLTNSAKMNAAHARKLHDAFEKHPDCLPGECRVALKADAVDVANLDLNIPATSEGMRERLRSGGLPRRALGEALYLAFSEDDARALGLPKPHPDDIETIRSLFGAVDASTQPLQSVQQRDENHIDMRLLKFRREMLRAAGIVPNQKRPAAAVVESLLDRRNGSPKNAGFRKFAAAETLVAANAEIIASTAVVTPTVIDAEIAADWVVQLTAAEAVNAAKKALKEEPNA